MEASMESNDSDLPHYGHRSYKIQQEYPKVEKNRYAMNVDSEMLSSTTTTSTTSISSSAPIAAEDHSFSSETPKSPAIRWNPKLKRVIAGHQGWVRSITVDTSNEWFITGSTDRTIKIWDLASGELRKTLTGHISAVRGLAMSPLRPNLFSVGEDKAVKCWDLEYNRVIHQFRGHLSGVYCCALHPQLDILVTGGRDSVARVWDIRTTTPIHVLTGHEGTVASLGVQSSEPQIVTGSFDSTVRLWDVVAGKTRKTLTHHKKSVRALAISPIDYSFLTASSENIRHWTCPDGDLVREFSGHESIINSIAVNEDGVVVSSADNGSMFWWDYYTGECYAKTEAPIQPGSLESERGVFASAFDMTGSRLITCEADKTIKVWINGNEEVTDSG